MESWLVGGTGVDHLHGGTGNDMMNADDNLDTNGGANTLNDVAPFNFGDIAFGDAGQDTLIANGRPGAQKVIVFLSDGDANAKSSSGQIAAAKGVTLAGAIEAEGSALIGRDAGELAGLGANGIKVASDAAPLLQSADGLIELLRLCRLLGFLDQVFGLLLEALILIGNRELHAGCVQALSDRPRDRALVGDAKNHTGTALKV